MIKKSVNFNKDSAYKVDEIAREFHRSFGFMVRMAVNVYLCYRTVLANSDTSDPKSDVNIIQRIFAKHGLKSVDH